jgi:hypothetical protein
MIKRRNRIKQTMPLNERLGLWAQDVRDQAAKLPPGAEKDELTGKARQAETAARLENWLGSVGLQPPK